MKPLKIITLPHTFETGVTISKIQDIFDYEELLTDKLHNVPWLMNRAKLKALIILRVEIKSMGKNYQRK